MAGRKELNPVARLRDGQRGVTDIQHTVRKKRNRAMMTGIIRVLMHALVPSTRRSDETQHQKQDGHQGSKTSRQRSSVC